MLEKIPEAFANFLFEWEGVLYSVFTQHGEMLWRLNIDDDCKIDPIKCKYDVIDCEARIVKAYKGFGGVSKDDMDEAQKWLDDAIAKTDSSRTTIHIFGVSQD